MKTFWLVLAIVGIILLFILLLPLILPTAFALHVVYLHRLRSAASRFACTGCGQILGKESLGLADAEWARRMQEMRIKYPGVKFRVVRHLHAICPKCEKRYRFLEQTRSFEEVKEGPTA